MFFALVLVFALNQGKTLEGIELALADFESEQREKVTDRSARLQALLESTWGQFKRVRLLLWVMRALVLVLKMTREA